MPSNVHLDWKVAVSHRLTRALPWLPPPARALGDESSERFRQAHDGAYLSCPRCGLRTTPRTPWLAIKHCPRCLARAGMLVELVGSAPRARAWEADGPPPRRAATPPELAGATTIADDEGKVALLNSQPSLARCKDGPRAPGTVRAGEPKKDRARHG